MISLFPYREFRLESRLPPEEVSVRLAAAVASPRRFRGEVGADGFKFARVIGYRNSFLPIVRGRVTPAGSGSRVEGTMEMHLAVGAFMALWLSGVLLGCVVAGLVTAYEVLSGRVPNPALVVPFVMLALGWGTVALGFGLEAQKALRLLEEIVGAEQV